MKRPVRSIALLGAFAVVGAGLAQAVGTPVGATEAPQPLPYEQPWSNPALISVPDNWDGVPGVVGYRGDGLVNAAGADPRTVVGEGTKVVDVNVDQTNPTTFTTGGVTEFAIADPVVALAGSGTADAPNLVLTLATTGFVDVTVAYDVRDIDPSADNAVQQVALQYRVGTAGDFTDLPGGYIADATTAGTATQVTPISVVLPSPADDTAVVQVRVITTDAPGSDEWVGIDGISVTGTPGQGGPAEPVATCPASVLLDEGQSASAVVSATDADSAVVGVAITSAAVAGIALTPGAPGTATLEVAPSTVADTHPVDITFTTDDGQTVTCRVVVSIADELPVSGVQGPGAATPRAGDRVIVDAVVTSPFTTGDRISGAFVQEAPEDGDGDPATSEGIFVFCGSNCPAGLAKGAVLRAKGVAEERFGTTQISAASPGATTVVGTDAVPPAVVLDLPSGAATEATYESIEGMLTTFRGTLTLREHFNMPRFGEIELYADGVPYTQTHVGEPVPGTEVAFERALDERTLVLDDDNDDENDAIRGPGADEPYPYPTSSWGDPTDGLSLDHRFRIGDTTSRITGVMQWSFGKWRMRPVPGLAYELTSAGPDPVEDGPPEVGGRLRIASFNVLNYFTTPDTTESEEAGPCGPTSTQDCRGADSEAERVLQLAKITAAIAAMRPDVVGLIEIENDAGRATQDIVDALNASLETDVYRKVETGFIGTDAIKVAFIYRSDTVATVGGPKILDSRVDPRFVDTRNRPALIQTFEELATSERFTATINHLKSKGSSCGATDPDLMDGAGNCNLTRTAAAQALADHLATDPTDSDDPDVIILGDLNAYRNEEPIDELIEAGYTDLVRSFAGDGAYSYLFDGTVGYLDHALANGSMTPQVTGVAEWHINAAEPEVFDYNDTEQTAGEPDDFERRSDALPLASPDARRSSDHDPVIVGLDLASLTIDDALIVQGPRGGGTLVFAGTTGTMTDGCPTLALKVGASAVPIGRTTQLGRTTTCISLTSRGLVSFDRRTGAIAGALSLPSSFKLAGPVVRFDLTVTTAKGAETYRVLRDGDLSGNGRIWTSD